VPVASALHEQVQHRAVHGAWTDGTVKRDNQRLALADAGTESNAMPNPRMKKPTIGSLANDGQ